MVELFIVRCINPDVLNITVRRCCTTVGRKLYLGGMTKKIFFERYYFLRLQQQFPEKWGHMPPQPPPRFLRHCAVKQALDPRVIWIMHTSVSYITKLYGSIMKGQIATNQYVLSLKCWIKSLHLPKYWSRHAGSTSINVLNGTLSMVPLDWLLHIKWLQNYLRVTHTSQCMERYSENFQVNSSFIN